MADKRFFCTNCGGSFPMSQLIRVVKCYEDSAYGNIVKYYTGLGNWFCSEKCKKEYTQMRLIETLEPCPLCSSPVKLLGHDGSLWKIECTNEDCPFTTVYNDKHGLIVSWNNRPRAIPHWLKSQLIGKTEEFIKIKHLDSYQEGYDDAINWVLSLEE